MTYKGITGDGAEFFAYILCNEAQVLQMRKDYETKTNRTLSEYGEVLYIDYIDEPDAKAKDFLNKWITENNGNLM